MADNIYNYAQEIKINPIEIERELIDQPELFMKYAELHADAIQEKDRQKQKLDLLYSELEAEVRSNYMSYFTRKPTENQIKSWIAIHPRYVKAQEIYSNTCRNVNVTAGAKEAFAQRRFILGNIVSMKIAGIFSDPKPKGDNVKALNKRVLPKKKLFSK